MICEFSCRECMKDFDCVWTFGEVVRCPHCKIEWETDWDTDDEDNIYGPWLGERSEKYCE